MLLGLPWMSKKPYPPNKANCTRIAAARFFDGYALVISAPIAAPNAKPQSVK